MGIWNIAKDAITGVAKGVNNSIGNIGDIGIGIGKAAWKSQEYIGEGVMGIGKGAWKMATSQPFDKTTAAGRFGNYVGDPIGRYATAGKNMMDGLVKEQESKLILNEKTGHLEEKKGGYALKKAGWAAVVGATAYQGFTGVANTYESSNEGQQPNQITSFTPKIDDAGATGDLVFALHNNRKG